jgi:hypothetical protein
MSDYGCNVCDSRSGLKDVWIDGIGETRMCQKHCDLSFMIEMTVEEKARGCQYGMWKIEKK